MDTSELRQMAEELGLTSKHWLHPDFDTNTESEPIEFEEISIPVVERISINMDINPFDSDWLEPQKLPSKEEIKYLTECLKTQHEIWI